MAKAKRQTKIQPTKQGDFSKLALGIIVGALLVLVVFGISGKLSGAVVAVGINQTVDRVALVLEPISLNSIQIGGNATLMSFSAIAVRSVYSNAFAMGAEHVGTAYLITKNRTRFGADQYVGSIIYLNSSSVYVVASRPSIANAIITNRIQVAPEGRSNPSRETVTLELSGNGFFINKGTATRGIVRITDLVSGYLITSRNATWGFHFAFGAGSLCGLIFATDAGFREGACTTRVGKASLQDGGNAITTTVPLCSTRGSCISRPITSNRAVLLYATQQQSVDLEAPVAEPDRDEP